MRLSRGAPRGVQFEGCTGLLAWRRRDCHGPLRCRARACLPAPRVRQSPAQRHSRPVERRCRSRLDRLEHWLKSGRCATSPATATRRPRGRCLVEQRAAVVVDRRERPRPVDAQSESWRFTSCAPKGSARGADPLHPAAAPAAAGARPAPPPARWPTRCMSRARRGDRARRRSAASVRPVAAVEAATATTTTSCGAARCFTPTSRCSCRHRRRAGVDAVLRGPAAVQDADRRRPARSIFSQVAVHWEIARMLLDYVMPPAATVAAPGRDDMVRQWYRATAAWMQQPSRITTRCISIARGRSFPPIPISCS